MRERSNMQYRKDRYGNELSALGFGCMRFSRKGAGIDLEKAEQEILEAFRLGVNYYDTAYIYPGSEACLGEILKRNGLREKVHIATKLPQYMIKSRAGIDRYFGEQKRRLQTDYIDYYLMHMLTDVQSWHNLEALGIVDWIAAKKQSGEIRQIGFSFHGNTEMFLQILNAYDWDFCQIQYNYMDEHSQAGRAGLEAAAARGIPVIIMEPLRGGRLINMIPKEAKQLIEDGTDGWTPAEFGLRWIWNQPQATVVLSGMNSLEMVRENAGIADKAAAGSFTEKEAALTERVRETINAKLKVACTGCGYCMPCPQGVDIPGAFRCYNEMFVESRSGGRHEYLQTVGLRKQSALPSQCIGCGRCEQHCPQHLSIIKELKNAERALLPLHYKAALGVARAFVMHGKGRTE